MVCVLPLAKDSMYIHRQMGNLDRQWGDKVENLGAYLKAGGGGGGGAGGLPLRTPGIFFET